MPGKCQQFGAQGLEGWMVIPPGFMGHPDGPLFPPMPYTFTTPHNPSPFRFSLVQGLEAPSHPEVQLFRHEKKGKVKTSLGSEVSQAKKYYYRLSKWWGSRTQPTCADWMPTVWKAPRQEE